jgi:hypothetical protein
VGKSYCSSSSRGRRGPYTTYSPLIIADFLEELQKRCGPANEHPLPVSVVIDELAEKADSPFFGIPKETGRRWWKKHVDGQDPCIDKRRSLDEDSVEKLVHYIEENACKLHPPDQRWLDAKLRVMCAARHIPIPGKHWWSNFWKNHAQFVTKNEIRLTLARAYAFNRANVDCYLESQHWIRYGIGE